MHTRTTFVSGAQVVLFGPGYVGEAVCNLLTPVDCHITRVARTNEKAAKLRDVGHEAIVFDDKERVTEALSKCTHLLSTVAPNEDGEDPILAMYSKEIANSNSITWTGYLSSTSVYGDRNGEEVTEADEPMPNNSQSSDRLRAEKFWQSLRCVDVLRLAGVYGPRRSPITTIRQHGVRESYGDQICNRIHVQDAAWAIICAARRDNSSGQGEVFNLSDDMPASREDVFNSASRFLSAGRVFVKKDTRELSQRDINRTSKRVSNEKLKQVLGVSLKYPSYYHGLAHVAALEGLFGDEMARKA